MTPKSPYRIDANPKNTFNWLSEASETIKIKPRMDSGPLFHPVITTKIHSQGIAKVHGPLGHPTMLMLSDVGQTNPNKVKDIYVLTYCNILYFII